MSGYEKLLGELQKIDTNDVDFTQDMEDDNVIPMIERVISVEGYADDLYAERSEMKQTRLFYLMPENDDANTETLDVCITSTNPNKNFPIFDKLLGKKIRISIDILE